MSDNNKIVESLLHQVINGMSPERAFQSIVDHATRPRPVTNEDTSSTFRKKLTDARDSIAQSQDDINSALKELERSINLGKETYSKLRKKLESVVDELEDQKDAVTEARGTVL